MEKAREWWIVIRMKKVAQANIEARTSTACWESEEERWAEAWNLRKAWARLVAALVRAPGRSVSRSSARCPSVNASRLLQLAVRRTLTSALSTSAKLLML